MVEIFVGIIINIPEFGPAQSKRTSSLLIAALQKRTKNLKLNLLLDKEVTYDNVRHLLEDCNLYLSKKNRRAIIYYNGHGGQTKDLNGDEDDGLDEFWQLESDKRMIDDEISKIFSDISEKSFLLLINDNCSSGTMIDKKLNDRPWICLSSCQDHQESLACKDGGIFTLYGLIPGIEKRDTIRGIQDEIVRGVQLKSQKCMLTMTRDYLLHKELFSE